MIISNLMAKDLDLGQLAVLMTSQVVCSNVFAATLCEDSFDI